MPERKNSVDVFTSTLGTVEEKVSEVKDRPIDTIQTDTHGE